MDEILYESMWVLPAFNKIKDLILDDNITDIDSDSDVLVIRSSNSLPRIAKVGALTNEDIKQIGFWVANQIGVQFNAMRPYVEADYHELRISVTSDSVATSGCGLTIRKVPAVCRITDENILSSKYATKRMVNFLKDAIESDLNAFVSGLPAVGKTELIKYLLGFIKPWWKIITIEDLNELHAKKLYPERCIEEDRVNEFYSWDTAIEKGLRKNPHHLIFAEARGSEVKQLLTAILTGTKCVSSIHSATPYEIPSRVKMMMGNDPSSDALLFEAMDIAFGIDMFVDNNDEIHRYIKHCVAFDSKDLKVIKFWEYDYENDNVEFFNIPKFLKLKWRD